MSNRTVPAIAEGLPTSPHRPHSDIASALEALGYDAAAIQIVRHYLEMAPDDQRAFMAAVSASVSGTDPTEEIVAAVGTERAGRFVSAWRLLVAAEAEEMEAAR